ncbi:MAG: sigma-70 family RNA polymerase sigma factor [Oscillospiraceae bacterium]|jgi:RNA polymerase sporulation-specific sigma factor|nr:sigma-70 family RNA polymerase sigma factor [Oscillospiraceae bacterium]
MTTERNEFISENLGLVHSCARRYIGRGIEYDDLYQAGCMGLIKAADGFDKERGIRFSTYAVPAILGEIRRLFRDGGAVKVSRSLKELGMKVARATAEFSAQNGQAPHISEIADMLNVDAEAVSEAINASQHPVSLTVEGDSSENLELDLPTETFDDSLTDTLAVRQLVSELGKEDRMLIFLRYFKGKTQNQTAEELGMTQVQVSRREKAIIKQIRSKMIG